MSVVFQDAIKNNLTAQQLGCLPNDKYFIAGSCSLDTPYSTTHHLRQLKEADSAPGDGQNEADITSRFFR
jgi:hypothetical protein